MANTKTQWREIKHHMEEKLSMNAALIMHGICEKHAWHAARCAGPGGGK
jgi:hypothetical protein